MSLAKDMLDNAMQDIILDYIILNAVNLNKFSEVYDQETAK